MTDKFISAADGCFYAQQQRNGTWVIGGDSNYEIYDATYPREVTFSFSTTDRTLFPGIYADFEGREVIRSWSGQLDIMLGRLPCHFAGGRGRGGPLCGLCIHRTWLRDRPCGGICAGPDGCGRRLPPICPACRRPLPAAQPLAIESAASSRPEVHRKGMDL